jgi:hypothetical protein
MTDYTDSTTAAAGFGVFNKSIVFMSKLEHKIKTWKQTLSAGRHLLAFVPNVILSRVGNGSISVLTIFRLCYRNLDLLLMAIDVPPDEFDNRCVMINPTNDYYIDQDTDGFFVAQDEAEVKRWVTTPNREPSQGRAIVGYTQVIHSNAFSR